MGAITSDLATNQPTFRRLRGLIAELARSEFAAAPRKLSAVRLQLRHRPIERSSSMSTVPGIPEMLAFSEPHQVNARYRRQKFRNALMRAYRLNDLAKFNSGGREPPFSFACGYVYCSEAEVNRDTC